MVFDWYNDHKTKQLMHGENVPGCSYVCYCTRQLLSQIIRFSSKAFLGTTNYTKQSKSRGKKHSYQDVVVNCNVNCRREVRRTMDGDGRKKTGGEDST